MDEIGIKMKELVQKYGLEIIRDNKKLNALLADLFPKEKKLRNAIRDALDAGAGRMFFDLAKSTGNDVTEKLAAIHKKLVDEAWLSYAAADSVCRIFLTAIGKDADIAGERNAFEPGTVELEQQKYRELEKMLAQEQQKNRELANRLAQEQQRNKDANISAGLTVHNVSVVPMRGNSNILIFDGRLKDSGIPQTVLGSQIKRDSIESVVFSDKMLHKHKTSNAAWDVSQYHDGSVIACVISQTLYIEAEGKIQCNDLSSLFENYSEVIEINFNNCLDTSRANTMSHMFYSCHQLTKLDLSSFNTVNVTDMSDMFCDCHQLTKLDLSSFSTVNVTNMSDMFCRCYELKELDLSSFNTANVTNMSYMFYYCTRLKELDLSSFNTANVTNMRGMFNGCRELKELDLSSFDIANGTNTGYMFYRCSKLKK